LSHVKTDQVYVHAHASENDDPLNEVGREGFLGPVESSSKARLSTLFQSVLHGVRRKFRSVCSKAFMAFWLDLGLVVILILEHRPSLSVTLYHSGLLMFGE
jgi:hypothetical protein